VRHKSPRSDLNR